MQSARTVKKPEQMTVCLAAALWSAALSPAQPPAATAPSSASELAEEDGLPAIRWPVTEAYRRLYPDRVSILEPLFPDSSRTGAEIFVLYSGSKIDCLTPRTGRSAWPAPVDCRSQPVFLGAADGWLIFATPLRVFAVNSATGHQAWAVGDDPPEDPSSDPEALETWSRHFLPDGRLFSLSNRGRLSCIRVRDGSLLWRCQTGGGSAGQFAADAKRVYVVERRGGEAIVVARDALTGQDAHEWWRVERETTERLLPVADRALLIVTGGAVISLDATTGREVFRIAPRQRLTVPTVQVFENALLVADETGSIGKYDLTTGGLLWRTPSAAGLPQGTPWIRADRGLVYAATPDRLSAFSSADGALRWRHEVCHILNAQQPICTRDALVTLSPVPPDHVATQPGSAGTKPNSVRYLLHAYDRRGRPLAAAPGGGDFLTAPLCSFGGLLVRDGALALLDGNILIGYVEQPAATQKREAESR